MKSEIFDDIKPKAIGNEVCYVSTKFAMIDFGRLKVIKEIDLGYKMSVSGCKFSELVDQKSLIQLSDADARAVESFFSHKPSKTMEMPMTERDVAFCNSIASIGRDLFFCGKISLHDKFAACVTGLIYHAYYNVDFKLMNNMQVPWETFYYLYQMFKNVTKKSPGVLRYGFTDDLSGLIIYCDTYRIIVNGITDTFAFEDVHNRLSAMVKDSPGKTYTRKLISEKYQSTTFKHLSKFFLEDQFSVKECSELTSFNNEFGQLFIFNKRG